MVLYNVFSHPVLRRYKASFFSTATFLYLFLTLVTVIAPLLVAYWSQGLWLKEATFREQPEVHFTYQFLFLAEGSFLSTPVIGYSTFQNFNTLLNSNQRLCLIKSHEEDTNRDGKLDRLNFELELPLANFEQVSSVKLVLLFDYKLHTFASVQMQSLAYVHHSSPLAGAGFHTSGQLSLLQQYPLPNRGTYSVYNVPVIDSTSSSADAYQLEKIFKDYSQRNVSTMFKALYPVWKPGRVPNDPFVMSVQVQYPEETITYRPGFWQTMKMAWIQYVALLVIFTYSVGFLKRALFENQLVSCVPQPSKAPQ